MGRLTNNAESRRICCLSTRYTQILRAKQGFASILRPSLNDKRASFDYVALPAVFRAIAEEQGAAALQRGLYSGLLTLTVDDLKSLPYLSGISVDSYTLVSSTDAVGSPGFELCVATSAEPDLAACESSRL